ncbi:hypothetical protein F0U44_02740 [Nocardioides humilatus]|uniref:Uncharacterized protein n=1 Tax=Nocardioides humilatus TaxID=2607660 RepID=A0A5B1LLD7_9ACTN|nr:hypothetical protein [Nocardioides humilatus]KAA1421246.1 hypothetical protein F0U44_02740 [Nocardioides humilatus]
MNLIARVCVAALMTVTLGSFSACGGDERSSSPSPSPSPSSTSASASPSPTTPSPSPTFTPMYGPVADYLDAYLPGDFPGRSQYISIESPEQDDAFATACGVIDDNQPDPATRTQIIKTLASGLPGKSKGDKVLGELLLDAIFEGCWETGFAERPWVFDAKDYGKYSDVLSALHEAGFDEFIEDAQKPGSVGNTCYVISREPEGGKWFRDERRGWIEVLTETGVDEWGWTERRASKFVDVLFDACFSTGHSKPYVPPVPSIGNGIWTVGRNIPPGTYRSNGVTSGCYWAILRSGSNGQDIIANGLPPGGLPTVNLSIGQDFSTDGCGTWKKIG